MYIGCIIGINPKNELLPQILKSIKPSLKSEEMKMCFPLLIFSLARAFSQKAVMEYRSEIHNLISEYLKDNIKVMGGVALSKIVNVWTRTFEKSPPGLELVTDHIIKYYRILLFSNEEIHTLMGFELIRRSDTFPEYLQIIVKLVKINFSKFSPLEIAHIFTFVIDRGIDDMELLGMLWMFTKRFLLDARIEIPSRLFSQYFMYSATLAKNRKREEVPIFDISEVTNLYTKRFLSDFEKQSKKENWNTLSLMYMLEGIKNISCGNEKLIEIMESLLLKNMPKMNIQIMSHFGIVLKDSVFKNSETVLKSFSSVLKMAWSSIPENEKRTLRHIYTQNSEFSWIN